MKRTLLVLIATAGIALAANLTYADIVGGTANYFATGYKNGGYAQMVFSPGFGGKGADAAELLHERINSSYLAPTAWSWAAVGNGWFTSNGQPLTVSSNTKYTASADYAGKYLTHYKWNDVLNYSETTKFTAAFAAGSANHKKGTVTQANAGKTIAEGNKWNHTYQQRPGIVWETLGVKGTGGSTANVRAGVNAQGYGFGTGLTGGKYRNSGGEFDANALSNVRQQVLEKQGLTDTTARFQYFVIDLTNVTSAMVSFSGNLSVGNITSGSLNYSSLGTQTNATTIATSGLVYGQLNYFKLVEGVLTTSYGVNGSIKLASSGTNSGESQFNEWSMYFLTALEADAAQLTTFNNLKTAVNTANTNLDAANQKLASAQAAVEAFNAKVDEYNETVFISYDEALAAWTVLNEEYDAVQTLFNSADQLASDALAKKNAADAAYNAYAAYGNARQITILNDVANALNSAFNVENITIGTAYTLDSPLTLRELSDAPVDAGAATPEPATLAVLGLGLVGLAVLRRRKR